MTEISSSQNCFQFNLSLINLFRQFNHYNHKFQQGYLEKILGCLLDFKEKYQEFLSDLKDEERDQIIIGIHYYLASIFNLQEFILEFEKEMKVEQFLPNEINSTNILSIYNLQESLENVKNERLQFSKSQYFLAVDFWLVNNSIKNKSERIEKLEKEKESVVIDLELLKFGINARGKLDPFIVSYLCEAINKKFNQKLFSLIFLNLDFPEKNKQNTIYTAHFSETLLRMFKQHPTSIITEKLLEHFIKELNELQNPNRKMENQLQMEALVAEIEQSLSSALLVPNEKEIGLLEELLIGMLGHENDLIRSKATLYLNLIYSGTDWQMKSQLPVSIICSGEALKISSIIELEQPEAILLQLHGPGLLESSKGGSMFSWHSPKLKALKVPNATGNFYTCQVELGKVQRCGIYDWKCWRLGRDGFSEVVDLGGEGVVQGRVIVQPRGVRQLQVHEMYVESFEKIRTELAEIKEMGIGCVYLMGALERDNGMQEQSGRTIFTRPKASPFAVTCRKTPNRMLGGQRGFRELMGEAKRRDVKVVLDSLARVSSSRPSRKYRDKFTYVINSEGLKMPCFGTDGKSIQYEDSALLNYRRKDVWDLLVKEIEELVENYGIDGVHLDNGMAWPQIMLLDKKEMYRLDADGHPAHSERQIFQGEFVVQDEKSGYWSCSAKDKYPNPFYIKLCTRLWRRFPQFLVLCEAWVNEEFGNRDVQIVNSGLIARKYQMPLALSQVFGTQLTKSGKLIPCEKKNVNVFRLEQELASEKLPKRAVVIQSTTSYCWPYPALLYQRGAWPAVDVMFFLADIPMTFIGEMQGVAYREKITNIFTKISNNEHEQNQLQQQQQQQHQQQQQRQQQQQDQVVIQRLAGGQMTKVRSEVSLSELNLQLIQKAQEQIQQSIGPEYGFDLKQIWKHYQHRRQLRRDNIIFSEGKLIPLIAEDTHGVLPNVLAFARSHQNEIMIVGINFGEKLTNAILNLRNLKFLFKNYESSDITLSIQNLLEKGKAIIEYYNVQEFIDDKHLVSLNGYATVVLHAKIFEGIYNTEEVKQLALTKAVERLRLKLNSQQPINANYIATMFFTLLQKSTKFQQFLNGWAYYYKTFIESYQIPFYRFVLLMKQLRDDTLLNSKFFAFIRILQEHLSEHSDQFKQVEGVKELETLTKENFIGMVAFATPELGRWSTVGGIGVMVQDLAQGLAKLGQEVVIVTPFYKTNKKKQLTKLNSDTETFNERMRFSMTIGGRQLDVNVFEGYSQGVRIFFLQNEQMFPEPYADGDAWFTMEQMCCFGKSVLEVFCQIAVLPALIVTNDWFTAMVPAFAKAEKFGTAFQKTKFFHIVHNLDPFYEGRIYPKPNEGNLHHLHELPDEWLVNPDHGRVINPSRCALLKCDNWGTVSHSYLQELLDTSPLADILKLHHKPFSFPNGIPKLLRLQKVKDLTENNHEKSKELIQQKYFHFNSIDDSIMLIAFVGRITSQKGVHLIVDNFERLYNRLNHKLQVIVGGMSSNADQYGRYCADKLYYLKKNYEFSFWAAPDEFFYDGTLINCGCDFGLMPSKFEPGGIVQHEFFVASTPVIAHKTGGLKDTVIDFDFQNMKGSGCAFNRYTNDDFCDSVEKAYKIFSNKNAYAQIRKNAFEACIDGVEVAKAWNKEFHQMLGKVYYQQYKKNHQIYMDTEVVTSQQSQINRQWDPSQYHQDNLFTKNKGQLITEEERQIRELEAQLISKNKARLKKHIFVFKSSALPRPKKVEVCSSFDNWQKTHSMHFDNYSQRWQAVVEIQPGKYLYKFKVDGFWKYLEDEPMNTDQYGNVNNYIVIN